MSLSYSRFHGWRNLNEMEVIWGGGDDPEEAKKYFTLPEVVITDKKQNNWLLRLDEALNRGDFLDPLRSSFLMKAYKKLDDRLHVSNAEHYKWEGANGFKQYGWPTMMTTWSVLSMAITGGQMGVFASERTFFNMTSMGLNAYNTFGPATPGSQTSGALLDGIDFVPRSA